jgi:hypothetical protein
MDKLLDIALEAVNAYDALTAFATYEAVSEINELIDLDDDTVKLLNELDIALEAVNAYDALTIVPKNDPVKLPVNEPLLYTAEPVNVFNASIELVTADILSIVV